MKKTKKPRNNAASRAMRAAAAKELSKKLRFYSYEITNTPLENGNDLPKDLQDRVPYLHKSLYTAPKEIIPELLQWKEKYPNVPLIYNYLSGVYAQIGEYEASRDLSIENYNKNPEYLFAKINYAQICLHEGNHSMIPEIFNNKFELNVIYPDRKKFHVSEFSGFAGVMCAYFCLIGQRENAELFYNTLKQVAPNSGMVAYAERYMHASIK